MVAVAAMRLTHSAFVAGDGVQLRLLDPLLADADSHTVARELARRAVSLGVLLEETLDGFSFDAWLTDLAFEDLTTGLGVNVTQHQGIEGGEGPCSWPLDPPAPPPEES